MLKQNYFNLICYELYKLISAALNSACVKILARTKNDRQSQKSFLMARFKPQKHSEKLFYFQFLILLGVSTFHLKD